MTLWLSSLTTNCYGSDCLCVAFTSISMTLNHHLTSPSFPHTFINSLSMCLMVWRRITPRPKEPWWLHNTLYITLFIVLIMFNYNYLSTSWWVPLDKRTFDFHPGVPRVKHCDLHITCDQCTFFAHMKEGLVQYKWKPRFYEVIDEEEYNLIIPLQLNISLFHILTFLK